MVLTSNLDSSSDGSEATPQHPRLPVSHEKAGSDRSQGARPLVQRLGRQSAWRLILQFASLAREQAQHRVAHTFGLRRYVDVDKAMLCVPDSAICRDAVGLVSSVSPAFLLNHCIRSYVFGTALGVRDRIRFDRELLFLACVMHDLGLTAEYDGRDDFELESARAAHNWMIGRGEISERADIVHDAIALHARIGQASRGSPEAKLTHLGAGVDVIGVRIEDFRPGTLKSVTDHWPREHFKQCFPPLILDQAGRKPRSNIAGHLGLGFAGRIATAPFAS